MSNVGGFFLHIIANNLLPIVKWYAAVRFKLQKKTDLLNYMKKQIIIPCYYILLGICFLLAVLTAESSNSMPPP